MAKALGTIDVTHVGLDGVNWTLLGKVKKMATPIKNNPVDSTDNDDNGAKSNLYGDQSYDLSATCNFDNTDPGQILCANAAANKSTIYVRHRPRGTGAGLPQIVGQLIVETADAFSTEHEKVAEFSLKGSSTGYWSTNNQ